MKKELKEKSRRFIGIDLLSNKFNICLIEEGSGEREHCNFLIDDEDLERFCSSLDETTFVMLEACTNAFKFAKRIMPFAGKVIVADTHKLKLISHTNKKTDKIDAEKIATVLKMQTISGETIVNEVYIPDDETQALRGLFRSYQSFTEMIMALKNKIHSLLVEDLKTLPKSELTQKRRKEISSLEMDSTFLPES